MPKTLHVIPNGTEWAVKSAGGKGYAVFPTQREAIKSAKSIVRHASAGQIVIYGRNGQIREHDTYGMPPIQDPPGKKSAKIERAVGQITIDRLGTDPQPPRG